MAQPIYLDHAATTPVREEVIEAMAPFFGPRFGNPSSVHRWGREARVALDEAHERVAACLGAATDELCFTSGGTEGDNYAILGSFRARRAEGRTVAVTTPIEHKAVLNAVHQVASEGGEERLVEVTADGVVDAAHFVSLLDDRTAIASAMWVNNETGVIQPVAQLVELAHSCGALFHTDAVQAFGKLHIDAREIPFDLLTISGHKIGAPKGIGALFIRRKTVLAPLMHGGSQDRGRRPGTENVAFAVGLAVAAELAVAEREKEQERLRSLRDTFEAALVERIPDVVIHGRDTDRAGHVSNVSIPGTNSESMLIALDLRGVACSAGSACQSGSISSSHVLAAMKVPPDLGGAALRFSFGKLNDEATPLRTAELLGALAARSRGTFPLSA